MVRVSDEINWKKLVDTVCTIQTAITAAWASHDTGYRKTYTVISWVQSKRLHVSNPKPILLNARLGLLPKFNLFVP